MIKLRMHHINCLLFYRGKGYDEEFVRKMNFIYRLLTADIDSKIKLILSCDDLCRCCPNRIENEKCITNEKVLGLDERTKQEFNLQVDKIYTFRYIINNIYSKYSKENFENICNGCEWQQKGICNEKIIKEQKDKFLKLK